MNILAETIYRLTQQGQDILFYSLPHDSDITIKITKGNRRAHHKFSKEDWNLLTDELKVFAINELVKLQEGL
jgi:hypothetical protein